jgi:hypothetical protein
VLNHPGVSSTGAYSFPPLLRAGAVLLHCFAHKMTPAAEQPELRIYAEALAMVQTFALHLANRLTRTGRLVSAELKQGTFCYYSACMTCLHGSASLATRTRAA